MKHVRAQSSLLFVLLLLKLCTAEAEFINKAVKVDGFERTYILQTPSSYDGKKRLPLVFVLHGGGGSGKNMINFTGFGKLCEKEGFIAVYPDAHNKNWNDARGFLNSRIDDVKFFRVMIEKISAEYQIDSARIYATGISNGAMMCYTLACRCAENFAAIAAIAGNLPEKLKDEKPLSPVSIMIMNGTEDPLVPNKGGQIKVFGRERGKVLSTDETLTFWIKVNGCSKLVSKKKLPDINKNDGCDIEETIYENPENGVEVILYRIAGGGHTWPGAVQYLPENIIGKTNRDINATYVIWEFFKRHKKEIK
ncbi:MAG: dienelactone hydrolase family protein [bacterium]|nr:dienelactone hydrolase family protein [bacterium]